MSQLLVRQRTFSRRERLEVLSTDGEHRYSVVGSALPFSRQIELVDSEGTVVAQIARQWALWRVTFTVAVDGQVVTRIRQRFAWFALRFDVENDGTTLVAEGDPWGRRLRLARDGEDVVTSEGAVMSLTPVWHLDVLDDDLTITAIALIVAVTTVKAIKAAARQGGPG